MAWRSTFFFLSKDGAHDKDDSFEESKIDGDLNNLLNQIKEGNQLEGPFSPPTSTTSKDKNSGDFDILKCCRHWQYLYHFPLPQDDSSVHDCNQVHTPFLNELNFLLKIRNTVGDPNTGLVHYLNGSKPNDCCLLQWKVVHLFGLAGEFLFLFFSLYR